MRACVAALNFKRNTSMGLRENILFPRKNVTNRHEMSAVSCLETVAVKCASVPCFFSQLLASWKQWETRSHLCVLPNAATLFQGKRGLNSRSELLCSKARKGSLRFFFANSKTPFHMSLRPTSPQHPLPPSDVCACVRVNLCLHMCLHA